MNVLIIGLPDDPHVHIASAALRQAGCAPIRLYPLDLCGGISWSYDVDTSRLVVIDAKGHRTVIFLDEVDACWFRRLPSAYPLPHMQNILERAASESEVESFASDVFLAIESHVFCVNRFSETLRASNKLLQMKLARTVGFRIPPTVVSNELAAIENFLVNHGDIVYKPITSFPWPTVDPQHSARACTTTISSMEAFNGADVLGSPAIYQARVRRSVEVRATIMGRSVFAYEMRPRSDQVLRHADWRLERSRLSFRKCELPESVRLKCFDLMSRLGIVFGCFDFAIDEDGEYLFFEVNPAGQFLGVEDCSGTSFNLVDPFVRFLSSQDKEFHYHQAAEMLQVSEASVGQEREIELREAHFGDLKNFHFSKVSVEFSA